MKKQTLNTIAKKFFVGNLLVAALFLSTQNRVYANYTNHNKITVDKTSDNTGIKYVGLSKDYILFNVTFDNASGENFLLSVADESGEVLYRSFSKEKQFVKTYALPKNTDVTKVTFSIKSDKVTLEQSFYLNISTSVVENVTISKK